MTNRGHFLIYYSTTYFSFKCFYILIFGLQTCHSNDTAVVVCLDGKSYDAFLMCYKSDTDAGLNEGDRSWLRTVLEETFGYTLCLNDRDVLPGDGTYLSSGVPWDLSQGPQ